MAAGTMIELEAANGNIDTSDQLTMFEAMQKVFVVNGANLKVIDFTNTKLDLGSGNELTDPPAHGDILTQDQTSNNYAYMIVDFVDTTKRYIYGFAYYGGDATAFNTSNTVSSSNATAVMNPSTFTPGVVTESTIPHWYDWTVYPDCKDSDGVTLSYGAMPEKAYLGCNYRGRAVLSGDPEHPFQWYMSRQFNPWDWAYIANDAQSPVKGGNADAGEIGDIVRSVTPYKDDYLIFGCATSMWFIAGDPCDGGSLNELDLTVGMFGENSWCFDGLGSMFFWGTNGVYVTTIPGTPKCISEQQLPKLVKDEAVDPSTHRITLAYDRTRTGILTCITLLSDGSNSNYFFDLKSGGFFPEIYEYGAYSLHYYAANDSDYRDLLLGCEDGYIRKFNDSLKSDNASDDNAGVGTLPIDAYVTFGPIPMSPDPKLTGKLTGLDCVLAGGGSGGSQSDSDDVTCDVWAANSAAKIIEQLVADITPRLTKVFTAPGRRRGSIMRKKIKGVYVGIKLQNDTLDETWGLEQLMADFKPSGRLK